MRSDAKQDEGGFERMAMAMTRAKAMARTRTRTRTRCAVYD